MEYQSPLHKKLHDGVFVFTAETTPPDAASKETLISKIKPYKTILTNLHSSLDYYKLKKKLPKSVIPAHDGMNLLIN